MQGVEPVVPHLPVGRQPGVDLGERFGAQPVPAALGVLADFDQSGLAQHLEVFGHGGLAQREVVDEVADGSFPGAQQVEDVPAVWFGQDFEGTCHSVNIADGKYSCPVVGRSGGEHGLGLGGVPDAARGVVQQQLRLHRDAHAADVQRTAGRVQRCGIQSRCPRTSSALAASICTPGDTANGRSATSCWWSTAVTEIPWRESGLRR